MKFSSIIIGITASAILLAVLGFARLFTVVENTPDLTIREIETITFEPPPPPPPPEEQPPLAPPSPALTNIDPIPDTSRVPLPVSSVPMDITVPLGEFHIDAAPAPLPTPPAPERAAPRQPSPKPSPPRRSTPTPPKSHYSASELDGTPRLIRHGSATFPNSLARKGVTRGTVTLEVELSTSGSVSIRRVVSSTHPELNIAARRVASGARFTAPKKNGRPVKAIMHWPIVIQK